MKGADYVQLAAHLIESFPVAEFPDRLQEKKGEEEAPRPFEPVPISNQPLQRECGSQFVKGSDTQPDFPQHIQADLPDSQAINVNVTDTIAAAPATEAIPADEDSPDIVSGKGGEIQSRSQSQAQAQSQVMSQIQSALIPTESKAESVTANPPLALSTTALDNAASQILPLQPGAAIESEPAQVPVNKLEGNQPPQSAIDEEKEGEAQEAESCGLEEAVEYSMKELRRAEVQRMLRQMSVRTIQNLASILKPSQAVINIMIGYLCFLQNVNTAKHPSSSEYCTKIKSVAKTYANCVELLKNADLILQITYDIHKSLLCNPATLQYANSNFVKRSRVLPCLDSGSQEELKGLLKIKHKYLAGWDMKPSAFSDRFYSARTILQLLSSIMAYIEVLTSIA